MMNKFQGVFVSDCEVLTTTLPCALYLSLAYSKVYPISPLNPPPTTKIVFPTRKD